MLNISNPIAWLNASGSPFDMGAMVGRQGREAVHQYLLNSEIWAAVTSEQHETTVQRLLQSTQDFHPDIYDELRGLAAGLQLPLQEVAAWNCRGDILASVSDGCTTIQTPGQEIAISHNEDGLPFFRGHCFILDAKPANTPGFRAFCYPGSLAGHTFGWNEAGIVQAVNNLRLQKVQPTVPRMVLGRAVLAASDLQDAVDVLTNDPNSGGFHMTLAQVGNPKLLSVEYGAGSSSVAEITKRSAHTNHTTHLAHEGEIITQSSADRQVTAERLVGITEISDMEILRDSTGPGLPIRRDDPQDPDDENTLATCLFNLTKAGIAWRIYGNKEGQPDYQSEIEPA